MKRHTIIILLLITTTVVFIYFNPPQHSRFYPPCIAKKITGYDCAGCGSARACYSLLHGNIIKAADHNVLLLLLLPVMVIGIIHFVTGKLAAVWSRFNKPLFFLVLIVGFWIIRNIPAYPFTMLHSDG